MHIHVAGKNDTNALRQESVELSAEASKSIASAGPGSVPVANQNAANIRVDKMPQALFFLARLRVNNAAQIVSAERYDSPAVGARMTISTRNQSVSGMRKDSVEASRQVF